MYDRWFRDKGTYLVCNVIPVMLASEVFQVLLQQGPHFDDAVSHSLDFTQPLLLQLWVAEDFAGNPGTVDGRVGVKGTDKNLDLRVHARLFLRAVGDNAESTNTFTVEAHVLCKGLSQSQTVAFLDEQADGESIFIGVASGKTLVCHVEEWIVLLLLDDLADLSPLVLSRVDTGGIVSAGMEQDDAVVGDGLEIGDQALKVKTNGVLVVVLVWLHLQSGVKEDGFVVCPRRGGDIDGLVMRVMALEEGTTYSQSTSAGDGLGDGDTIFFDGFALGSVGKERGILGEGRYARDSGVFFVKLLVKQFGLGRADRGKDVGFAGIIT